MFHVKSRFKDIAGWEKWGSKTYLRVNLAEPELTAVWPYAPSLEEPQGEVRKLKDKIILLSDVHLAVQDSAFAEAKDTVPAMWSS